MNPTETQKVIFRFFFYNQTEIADLGYVLSANAVDYPAAVEPSYDITNETPGIKEFIKRFNELEQERQKAFDEIKKIISHTKQQKAFDELKKLFPQNNFPQSIQEYVGSSTTGFDPNKTDITALVFNRVIIDSVVKKTITSKEDEAYVILGRHFGTINTILVWSEKKTMISGQEARPKIEGTAQVISETSPYIHEDLSKILKEIAEFDTQEITPPVAKKLEEALKKVCSVFL